MLRGGRIWSWVGFEGDSAFSLSEAADPPWPARWSKAWLSLPPPAPAPHAAPQPLTRSAVPPPSAGLPESPASPTAGGAPSPPPDQRRGDAAVKPSCSYPRPDSSTGPKVPSCRGNVKAKHLPDAGGRAPAAHPPARSAFRTPDPRTGKAGCCSDRGSRWRARTR